MLIPRTRVVSLIYTSKVCVFKSELLKKSGRWSFQSIPYNRSVFQDCKEEMKSIWTVLVYRSLSFCVGSLRINNWHLFSIAGGHIYTILHGLGSSNRFWLSIIQTKFMMDYVWGTKPLIYLLSRAIEYTGKTRQTVAVNYAFIFNKFVIRGSLKDPRIMGTAPGSKVSWSLENYFSRPLLYWCTFFPNRISELFRVNRWCLLN